MGLKWTGGESHGPTDVCFTSVISESGLTEPQMDAKIANQYQMQSKACSVEVQMAEAHSQWLDAEEKPRPETSGISSKSGKGLPHSKTLARHRKFLVPMRGS